MTTDQSGVESDYRRRTDAARGGFAARDAVRTAKRLDRRAGTADD